MYFKEHEFIELADGRVFEVFYVDDEKAICLGLKNCFKIGWIYTGQCIVVSNKSTDYENLIGVKKVSNINIEKDSPFYWKPLRPKLVFDL